MNKFLGRNFNNFNLKEYIMLINLSMVLALDISSYKIADFFNKMTE